MSAALLSAQGLQVRIGHKQVVQDLNLNLERGDTLAILGRNGMGKTTLLHTLAGLRPALAGQILLDAQAYSHWDSRAAARRRGVLAQHQLDAFPATVLETALIGRHPHLGRWAWEGDKDQDIAKDCLKAVGLAGMESRSVHTLSGGERQRLAIATLLAQQPLLYLLDEPTTHLDLNHQLAMLDLVSRYAQQCGAGFIMVLHDVNWAVRYCRRALLLFGEGRWLEGPVDDVLTTDTLSELYGHPLLRLEAEGKTVFLPK